MKKLIALLVALTLALSLVPLTAGAEDSIDDNAGGQPITVYLDGQLIDFECQPILVNDIVYVPLYAMCAALPMGCTVSYDGEAQIATLDAPGVHVSMTVGAYVMVHNYINSNMPNPLLIISDVLYGPVEAIARVFCYNMSWESDSNTVKLGANGRYQTVADWNDDFYYIGDIIHMFNMGIGILYNKVTGVPTAYGFFDDGYLEEGALFYENGDYYIGEYKNGVSWGHGEYHWADGSYYTGDFKSGVSNGHGELHRPDGSYYTGEWQDGERNGYGEEYQSNGDFYKGNWKDDEKDGLSEYHWSDGSYYVGTFINDEMAGRGTVYYPDGSKLTGYWSGGVYVGP